MRALLVHAYISTSPLIVHACMSRSLDNVYVASALVMYMNVPSYHACLHYINACPPIVYAYIATSPLFVHACMSISLNHMYITTALLMYMHSYHACLAPS